MVSIDCNRLEELRTKKKSHPGSYKVSTGAETNKENRDGLNDLTHPMNDLYETNFPFNFIL